MAISVKGKLADKVSKLLGGKNITEKRLETLLDDIEKLQAENELLRANPLLTMDPPEHPITTPLEEPRVGPHMMPTYEVEPQAEPDPAFLREEAMRELAQASPGQTVYIPAGVFKPGEMISVPVGVRIMERPTAPVTAPLPQPAPAPVAAPPPDVGPLLTQPPGLSAAERFILDKLQALSDEIRAVKSGQIGDEQGQAIMASRLPPPSAVKPPLVGPYRSYSEIPRGEWVKSPFGPPVKIQKCGCGRCTDQKELHYYCSMCGGGAHDLLGVSRPYEQVGAYGPAGSWGVNHYSCSEQCSMRYQAIRGMRAGVPVPLDADFTPARPMSLMSD